MSNEKELLGADGVMPPPENLQELVANMTPVMYGNLQQAIELGKWDDGSRLTPEQTERCMQLVILYEEHHLPEAQRTYANLPKGCGAGSGVWPGSKNPLEQH